MERILSNAQMRLADEYTINNLGISSKILVERAGTIVAKEIEKRFYGGRVLVCIGKGNNGEDGKIIAKYLSKIHGFSVATVNVYNGIFKVFDNKFDIIVDCIFGTGLNREVDGKYKQAIEKINNSGAFVVSCDIPSGLNGDTGTAMGVCVKANLTIAIQEFKLGHFLNNGPDYCGEVIAKDIGISVWGDDYVKKITPQEVSTLFSNRPRNVHKGNFGKTCVVGGSKYYPGSVLLSTNGISALKMGVGYCNMAVAESLVPNYVCKNPECTFTPLKDNDGFIEYDEKSIQTLLKYNSIAFGMGLGVSESVYNSLKYLLENYTGKLIIDADGLNSLAKYGTEIIKNKKCSVLLTPHLGEFSRLINKSIDEIQNDIIEISRCFAKEFNVVLVLKSATSVITDGEEVYLNTTGCSGMAKGGSGDVLSGLLAGLLAREEDTFFTTICGTYLFGLAGEIAQVGLTAFSMLASDIISCIPHAIKYVLDKVPKAISK